MDTKTKNRSGVKRPLIQEEKDFIDANYKHITILQLMEQFKRPSGKIYYDYYDQNGYTPFRKRELESRKKSDIPNDGMFRHEGHDWLT